MKDLKITGASDTFFTPNIEFQGESGVCIISGESYLENTVEFYKQILDWLRSYMETMQPIDFHFSLTYYNTSSSKAILQIMNLLKDYENKGGKISVTWHYNPDDEDMREEAEDYELDTGIKLNIIGDIIK
ncbi:MAG: DUF1987 domain-containing protein [Cytophagales bacterium]|nr:DUF1987 domain-containing protein [Cytophagales bacterium]